MRFDTLSKYFDRLESVSSRIAMTEVVAELYKEILAQDKDVDSTIEIVTYMLSGSVVPAYHKLEFNYSIKLLLKTISAQVSNMDIAEEYSKAGDIGILVDLIYKDKKSGGLDVLDVHKKLISMANLSGKDSQKNKGRHFLELSKKLSTLELRYVARLIVGKLRLGLSSKTIIDSISWAINGDKSDSKKIEHLFGITSDLGVLARRIFIEGLQKVASNTQVTPGIPVASKLVQRSLSSEDVYQRLQDCYVQPKLDGLRMQIHINKNGIDDLYSDQSKDLLLFKSDDKQVVRLFSRNLEDITEMFPDIVSEALALDIETGVFDSEAIGYDPKTKKYLPFQETIKRKRKYGIATASDEIPIRVNIFDVLHMEGQDMLKQDLDKRMELLHSTFGNNKGDTFEVLETTLIKSSQDIQNLFDKYVGEGLEGIIAKKIKSAYEPGTRNYDWIKLKASSKEGIADTIDAVVLGYYFGTGSRSKLGIGALLLGTYDPVSEKFIALSKLGTGVTEEEWGSIKKRLDPLQVSKFANNVVVNKVLMPDVVVSPEVVVVVEADEVSLSKINGIDGKPGYSLRFPRLKEFDRKDKDATQITDIKQLASLHVLRNK